MSSPPTPNSRASRARTTPLEVVRIATPQATKNTRDLSCTEIEATAWLAVTLDASDSGSVLNELQSQFEGLETALICAFREITDVAFLLKDRCDRSAHLGVLRDADILASGATVADGGEEITDCIVNCHSLTNGFSVGVLSLGGLPR